MNYLPDASLFLFLAASLMVAGWCLWAPSRSSFEAAFVPGAAILGLWGALVWAVGNFKLVPSFWIAAPWPLLVALIVWKRNNLAVHFGRTLGGLKKLKWDEGLWAFYLLLLFAITFVLTLAPPNGNDYDSLTYHLAVPAQYLRAGKVVELPFDHHSYFPFTLEMLYALGLAAKGPVFAKLFHWLMLPIGAFALLAIGKRAHSARAGFYASALYQASFYAGVTAGVYIMPDSAQMIFWTAALWTLALILRDERNWNYWLLFALAAGAGIMSKVHGAFLCSGLALFVLFHRRHWLRFPQLYAAAASAKSSQ
ncbi:hypothetical protein EON80_08575 [bacterium]|nr:MAG: hypothetical protein EON80_08575 [bacterium]